jgi:hypothetical protein
MTNQPIYAFTAEQLTRLLENTVDMFVEYRDVHGREEPAAKECAVLEMFQGVDADQELSQNPWESSRLQLTRFELAARYTNPLVDFQLNAGKGSYRP